jgi:ATP-dependent Clp protease ATP-binding subunit ClpA
MDTNKASIADTGIPLFGQKEAIARVDKAVRRANSGLMSRQGKPLMSFLFLGPSGVGKTESAKALAEVLYGDRNRVARFNANECAGEGGQFKAFGPPRGYAGSDKGGLLTQQVKAFEGRCVILVDEIEKGTQEIFDGLMAALDEGYMEDASFGERIPITSATIVMTSNILAGTDMAGWPDEKVRMAIAGAPVQNHKTGLSSNPFRMEFLGRIQEVIQFASLEDTDIALIIGHKYRNETAVKIAANYHLLIIDLSPKALGALCALAGGAKFGVRQADNVITTAIIDRIIDYPDLPTDTRCSYIWDFDEEAGFTIENLHQRGCKFLAEQREESRTVTEGIMAELREKVAKMALEYIRAQAEKTAVSEGKNVLTHRMIIN